MAIGLSYDELQKLFANEWHDYVNNRTEMLMISLGGEYTLEGFTAIQSQILAKKHAQMIAKTEAILEVIHQNNLEIEKQLKQRGIEV